MYLRLVDKERRLNVNNIPARTKRKSKWRTVTLARGAWFWIWRGW